MEFPHDDLIALTAGILAFELNIEFVLLIIRASGVRAEQVHYAKGTEPTIHPRLTHISADQHTYVAVAAEDGMITGIGEL